MTTEISSKPNRAEQSEILEGKEKLLGELERQSK